MKFTICHTDYQSSVKGSEGYWYFESFSEMMDKVLYMEDTLPSAQLLTKTEDVSPQNYVRVWSWPNGEVAHEIRLYALETYVFPLED